jgi:copper(I)-binding protein
LGVTARARTLVALIILVGSVASCATMGAAAPVIGDGWVRVAPSTDRPAAAYLVITNPSGSSEALLGASSPIAASVELHQSGTDHEGMTGMQPVERLDLPPGATVRLEPGGHHLMLLGLRTPLAVGDRVTLQLRFERAGSVTVELDVRAG